MKIVNRMTFVALFIAGAGMATVASREQSAAATGAGTATVIRSANLFGALKVCEVPGLHEHLLGKGTKTVVYAGEFTPTRVIPWTDGNARIVLYVVSGTGHVRVGNTDTKAGPGDVFIIPKGARHAVSAESGKLRALYFEERA